MAADCDRCHVNGLAKPPDGSPVAGVVRWDPAHSPWNGGMLAASLLLAPWLFGWGALAACILLAGATLLLRHSIGFHRRLIHRSSDCPLRLERVLIWAGTLVGMSDPLRTIRTHDLRDRAQWQAGPAADIEHRPTHGQKRADAIQP